MLELLEISPLKLASKFSSQMPLIVSATATSWKYLKIINYEKAYNDFEFNQKMFF